MKKEGKSRMVDFSLTPRQKELREIAMDYATTVVEPIAIQSDQMPEVDKSFNWDLVREASIRGLRRRSHPSYVW